MKELSIEEKAERYDEALERYKAKQEYESKEIHKFIEYIFPELKQSEDEKMRKWLINYLDNRILNSPIGEEKKACTDAITWLEKLGKQKPADKTESKFKSGDWVVYDGWICQIIDVTVDGYCNSQHGFIPKNREDSMRLWTIQDAKDGDVLVDGKGSILIFRGIGNQKWGDVVDFYVVLASPDRKIIIQHDEKFWGKTENVFTPATKEQCDTLMKAMADSGYTFDFEKKELKKIEQNPAWSEEDITHYNRIIKELSIQKEKPINTPYVKLIDSDIEWLESLKERVQPKQEWGKEDKKMLKLAIDKVEYALCEQGCDKFLERHPVLLWLKSIRPQNRWKPSDKQMEVLWKYAEQNNYDGMLLTSLYNDLKKLREE